ncbi:D-isomer specific 2-hydroxyacid dehydrogenase family protein [Leifsonia sp. Leaf264]|uniref:D-isomer specific 2-hydroxyacid dehydrogenase family protein n=1 Tax=Leifsonia sp. Leaf264 TaxID=1736314 RepID=UPI0006FCA5AE|nr:D-isomer specific 2-hydroxyacid dehydrogenase family protein [Leifsonia sp. Leaf264]KQP01178.1 hydroxyacid dehydrogenase [Leifsonia sp. Leaf264]
MTADQPGDRPVHRAVVAPDSDETSARHRPARGGIALLPKSNPVFEAAVTDADGTITPLDPDTRGIVWLSYARAAELGPVLEANPQIEWVQLPFAGVDAFSDSIRDHARENLLWTSAKGAYAQPVAEHALALSLALMRFLPRRIRAASWDSVPRGVSLYGRDVVIIGAGGIAIELIRLLEPFAPRITVVRRRADAVPGAAQTVGADDLHRVLPTADLVVVAAALTGGTRHLIGAPEFDLMQESAYLVNIARGGLVDTDALVTALNDGTIAGAGVDVTEPEPLPDGHPLWTAANVIITPHMADTPEMTAPLLAERIRHNVTALLGSGEFIGVVDPQLGY